MKSMTCKQLGGACDEQFQAETFEEIAKLSKQHGTEMFHKGDKSHLKAMENMRNMVPEEHEKWFEKKRKEFDALPED